MCFSREMSHGVNSTQRKFLFVQFPTYKNFWWQKHHTAANCLAVKFSVVKCLVTMYNLVNRQKFINDWVIPKFAEWTYLICLLSPGSVTDNHSSNQKSNTWKLGLSGLFSSDLLLKKKFQWRPQIIWPLHWSFSQKREQGIYSISEIK